MPVLDSNTSGRQGLTGRIGFAQVPTRDGQLTHPPVVIDVIEAREVVVEDVVRHLLIWGSGVAD